MMKSQTVLLAAIFLSFAMLVRAAEVGAPIDVAFEATETRSQTWAFPAWGEASQCWLVVWREGYLNEKVSDIWCARVSAEGKTLDAGGIRLTQGKGVKDRPKVVSDGKNFMIIWEDFRNGTDWDVYAARVSGEGVVLDKDPILVAGGAHSQCRPGVSFAKNNYNVVWMGFAEGKYDIYGTRLSSDGKVVGDQSANIFPFKDKPKRKNNGWRPDRIEDQGILPLISANRDGDMFAACFVSRRHSKHYLAWRAINPETGVPIGEPFPEPSYHPKGAIPGLLGWYRERAAALALGPDGGMLVSCSYTRGKSKKDISVTRFSKTGDFLSLEEVGSNLTHDHQFKPLRPRPAVAFDGKAYLAISDCQSYNAKGSSQKYRTKIVGWRIGVDGKMANPDGFLIAGEGDLDCMLPAVGDGPEGVCLVVYSEMRGMDDVKVLARVVK